MKPDALTLFAFYHLGIDRDGLYKFRNLHDALRAFGATAPELHGWLTEYRIDPPTVSRVDFNLAVAHTDAQIVAMAGDVDALRAQVRQSFERYLAALERSTGEHVHFSLDYDDVWARMKGETSRG